MLAMLVLHVASTLQMIRRREAVIGTQPMPTDLPRAATDTHQETNAAQQSSPPIALILRSAAKLRVSKDEGVLTTLSHIPTSGSVNSVHAFPAKAGIQSQQKSAQSAHHLNSRLRERCVLVQHANKNAAA